jgi:hypothetical protein
MNSDFGRKTRPGRAGQKSANAFVKARSNDCTGECLHCGRPILRGESYSYSYANSSFTAAGDPSKKVDFKELRRIDIEYGQKQDPDDRLKR